MAFEEFKPTVGRFTPTISIGRSGFGFSSGFAKKYGSLIEKKDGMSGIKLYFDRDRLAVGFKIVSTQEDGVIKLKSIPNGGYFLGARSFLVKYDIVRTQFELRYQPKVEQSSDGQLFVIELKRKV